MPRINAPYKGNIGYRRVGIKVSEDYHFDPEKDLVPKNSYSGLHISRSSEQMHKGTDPVKPYGYKRDILFGEKGSRSTGHLKDF